MTRRILNLHEKKLSNARYLISFPYEDMPFFKFLELHTTHIPVHIPLARLTASKHKKNPMPN